MRHPGTGLRHFLEAAPAIPIIRIRHHHLVVNVHCEDMIARLSRLVQQLSKPLAAAAPRGSVVAMSPTRLLCARRTSVVIMS